MRISFLLDNIGVISILSVIIIIFIVLYERNNNEHFKVEEKIVKENWLSSMDLKVSRISLIILVIFGLIFTLVC